MDVQQPFGPTATCENLQRRAKLLGAVREFFAVRGFLEVETPILSADTVVDRHLDPFPVVISRGDCPNFRVSENGTVPFTDPSQESPTVYWLQTSPEFAMKRLLAAGASAIYQIARVFRREEWGRLHNPEFTMVEWYRVGDGLSAGMQLLDELCDCVLDRGRSELLTYADAFERYVGIDPHRADTATLVAAARQAGISAPETLAETDRDGWLDLWLVERIQPHLGTTRPVILYDFPASQAALARIRPGPPAVAERFELYVSGMELANGYHELTDPAELRRRNAAVNAQRRADGKSPLPEESRLLAAMESGLPDSTGVALGFDRLAMLALGAKDLREVIAFPFDRA